MRPEAAEQLVTVVQQLSLARELETVMEIVRHAARNLTGADGATFVLREHDQCYYAGEDAIAPLWQGSRFPMSACISGWAMLHRQSAVIEDIYADPRIPADAYRPTFVKSLAMVPIRTADPIGAIGNYWQTKHLATPGEVRLLQALADSTSIAMENVQLYAQLEQRIRDRTAELETTNKELEAFSYSVSHDLRAPLRAIDGFGSFLQEHAGPGLDDKGRQYLARIMSSATRMNELIDDLLQLSRIARLDMHRIPVNLSAMAAEIVAGLEAVAPERKVAVDIAPDVWADADPRLVRVAMENLLSNAWKYTSKKDDAHISFSCLRGDDGKTVYEVRDNGAGFDMQHAGKLFGAFQRMHSPSEFPGNGVGLATAQRVIHRHGGRIWAESKVDAGASFHFTVG